LVVQTFVGTLTGSFTLDVYGGQPKWGRNLEAALLVGAEIEKAVNATIAELENAAQATTNGLSPFPRSKKKAREL
jgi:hypothetical protein